MAVVPAGPRNESALSVVDLLIALAAIACFCVLPVLGAPLWSGPVVLLIGVAVIGGRAAARRFGT
ncbi:MAG: hypothetical protein ACOYNI_09690 [Acidimicrobiia bacterium]